MKTLCLNILFLTCLLFSGVGYANINDVPLPDNFEVRMTLDKDYPMVISGFVQLNLDEVAQFYLNELGEPDNITDDIGRYTYFYTLSGKQLKVALYQQAQWCELSIMMIE